MTGPARICVAKENGWGRGPRIVRVDGWPFANPYFAAGTSAALRRDLYRQWIASGDSDRAITARSKLPRLRGKILACRCAIDQPCHADVLLELANAEPEA